MSLQERLAALEEQFWTAADRRTFFSEHLGGDAVMVFPEPAGMMDEEAILDSLDDAPAWASVRMEDATLVHLRDTAAVLAYRAEAARAGGETYSAYAASVYVEQDDGAWRLAFHQQTPIAS